MDQPTLITKEDAPKWTATRMSQWRQYGTCEQQDGSSMKPQVELDAEEAYTTRVPVQRDGCETKEKKRERQELAWRGTLYQDEKLPISAREPDSLSFLINGGYSRFDLHPRAAPGESTSSLTDALAVVVAAGALIPFVCMYVPQVHTERP